MEVADGPHYRALRGADLVTFGNLNGKGRKMKRKIRFVANAVKWFDKVNGNTYHSVNVLRCRDGAVLFCEMQYGYGDQYRQTALAAMLKAKWIPAKYGKPNGNGSNDLYVYEREHGYPIVWNEHHGLKRECVANGRK